MWDLILSPSSEWRFWPQLQDLNPEGFGPELDTIKCHGISLEGQLCLLRTWGNVLQLEAGEKWSSETLRQITPQTSLLKWSSGYTMVLRKYDARPYRASQGGNSPSFWWHWEARLVLGDICIQSKRLPSTDKRRLYRLNRQEKVQWEKIENPQRKYQSKETIEFGMWLTYSS